MTRRCRCPVHVSCHVSPATLRHSRIPGKRLKKRKFNFSTRRRGGAEPWNNEAIRLKFKNLKSEIGNSSEPPRAPAPPLNRHKKAQKAQKGKSLAPFVPFRGNKINKPSTNTAASCADFTTSSKDSSAVFGFFSLASTSGTDSRKLNSRLLLMRNSIGGRPQGPPATPRSPPACPRIGGRAQAPWPTRCRSRCPAHPPADDARPAICPAAWWPSAKTALI